MMSFSFQNQVEDDKAFMSCQDAPGPTPGPGPDPEEEQCMTGSACDGCNMYVEYNGIKYCCKNDCNYGWINVDPSTDPLCQCGH